MKVHVGDWARNAEGRVGVITSVDDQGKAIVKVPSTGKEISNQGWKVIVQASEVNENDPADLLKKEMRILNSPEALKLFATPSPEGQAARKNKICLCSVDQLTDVGHDFIRDKFYKAVAGKIAAKVLGIDKLGQIDFMAVKLGDDEDFPFTIIVEIARDGDGSPSRIRMLNSELPVEVLKDFAKFLNDIAKEAAKKSSACVLDWTALPEEFIREAMSLSLSSETKKAIIDCSFDSAEAGEKLERCVRQVMTRRIKEFRNKNGKEPSTKKRQEIESSAFAICKSQGLK